MHHFASLDGLGSSQEEARRHVVHNHEQLLEIAGAFLIELLDPDQVRRAGRTIVGVVVVEVKRLIRVSKMTTKLKLFLCLGEPFALTSGLPKCWLPRTAT